MNQTNKRRGGFYWINNKPYVSVTNVLKIIDKGQGLMYWFGKEVYLAMVKDPTLSERDALNAPYETRDKAAGRGSLVHSAIEAYRQNKVRVKPLPQYRGYLNAFYKWIDDFNPEILESEKTVFSDKYGYVGTLDMLAKINGKTCLIDFKTSKDGNLYDEVELQLSAYKNALQEPVDRATAVSLSASSDYNLKDTEDKMDIFLSALDLWKWKNKDLCKKVGYKMGGDKQ